MQGQLLGVAERELAATEVGRNISSLLMLQEGLAELCLKHPVSARGAGEPVRAPVRQP